MMTYASNDKVDVAIIYISTLASCKVISLR